MLMPLRDLRAIYEVLFRDGVMVAKKDKRPQTKHPEIESVSNLQVIRAMGSLKSKGCVKETFAWRHFYWYLTNEGIVYLRDYLHLPPEIVPASLQRVRRPAATLAIAHRAAKVQSIEGPTSYVPKPGRRGEAESQEALAERHSYRHRMMGTGEKESYSDRTPRFRGRPMAAEPDRQKASWETEERSQTFVRKGAHSEAAPMEESRVRRVAYQNGDMSREKPATMKTEEWKLTGGQKDKASAPAQVQRAAFKAEIPKASLESVPSKAALPSLGAAVSEDTVSAASKITVVPSTPKTSKEKPKTTEEVTFVKSIKVAQVTSAAAALSGAGLKEEKTQKQTVNPVNSAQVKAKVEMAADKVKSQEAVQKAVAQETPKPTPVTAIKTSVSKEVKEDQTVKVVVDSIKSTEVVAEKPGDEVKGKDLSLQDAFKVPTEAATPIITKPVSEDAKLEKEKLLEVLVKPAEGKPAEDPKMDQEKGKKSPQASKLPADANSTNTVAVTSSRTEFSSVKIIQESKVTMVTTAEKPQTDAESPIIKSCPIASSPAQAPAEDSKQVIVKSTLTEVKVKETADVIVTPQGKGREIVDTPIQPNQSAADTEVVMETKQMAESKSKSKRKKKKSPGDLAETIQAEEPAESVSPLEKPPVIKPPEVVTEKPAQPIISETAAVRLTTKTVKESLVLESRAIAEAVTERTERKEASHQTTEKTKIKVVVTQTEDQSECEAVAPQTKQVVAAPLVELPCDAKMNEDDKGISVGETTQPLFTEGKSDVQLVCAEPPAVTKVETVTVQKVCQVELARAVPKNEGTCPVESLQPEEPAATDKPTKEPPKGRKKGKGKKQAQTAVSDNINTGPAADELPSDNITSLPGAAVNDHLVTAPEPREVSAPAKTTPERMCNEETGPSAAVLSEARADKREVEPAPLSAEKIEQEVPKPKTSSTAREAHAGGESASARAAEAAAAAQAQASPLAEREEPPKVAQLSASEAVQEERLPASEASEQEEEKKKSEPEGEDTPSVPVTQAAPKAEPPLPANTCESASPDVDDAAMKKKIVVVEEIVEVKQIVSPPADGQHSSPPPVQPEVEEEEALDLDVLEAIAIQKTLLSEASGAEVQGASPDDDEWDHSLAEPEEKTWPNFVEGLFGHMPLILLPALPPLHVI